MRVIASAVALARSTRHSLVVYWMLNDELNCSYFDLFNSPGDFVVRERLSLLRRGWNKLRDYILRTKTVQVTNKDIYEWRSNGWDHPQFEDHFDTLLSNPRIRLVIESDWNFYPTENDPYRCLTPLQEHMDKVETVRNKFLDRNSVGVHIRRTDNKISINESPLSKFYEAMDEALMSDPQVKFFLATDDIDVQSALLKKYGERIVTFSERKERSSSAAMQEALIDLYCLASTRTILGSYWSSFTEVAGALNGSPVRIIKR